MSVFSGEIPAPYLVEVFLLLLYFGDIEQQTPHLPSELQGNSLIDPPHQLEGNKQQEVIVRKRSSSVHLTNTSSHIYLRAGKRFSYRFQSAKTSGSNFIKYQIVVRQCNNERSDIKIHFRFTFDIFIVLFFLLVHLYEAEKGPQKI